MQIFNSKWLLFWLLALSLEVSSPAAVYYISNTADTTNVTSLRGAIIAANITGGVNIIILTNSFYPLTIAGSDENASFTGDLDVTNGNLTIIGLSSSAVTISATNLGDRVMQIFPEADVSLYNLTITGGFGFGTDGTPNLSGDLGGGILNSGTLSLSDCLIFSNGVGQGGNVEYGGGLYNSGSAVMTGCVFSSNYCSTEFGGFLGAGDGGGIYNAGVMMLDSCVIKNNSASPGNGTFFASGASGGDGGGIYNANELNLNNCTICFNNTGSGVDGTTILGGSSGSYWVGSGGKGGDGGGIYTAGNLTMSSCTVNKNFTGKGGSGASGNPAGRGGAGGSGAGIYNSGNLIMGSCTVCSNYCSDGGEGGYATYDILNYSPDVGGLGADGGTGGAIFNNGEAVLLASTIIGNYGGSGGQGGGAQANGFYLSTSSNGIGGTGGNGGTGGIFDETTNDAFSLHNCLIALNFLALGGSGGQGQTTNGGNIPAASGNNGANDLAGGYTSAGFNLIGVNGGSGVTNGVNHDLVGSPFKPINPLLGSLTNNGGLTATMNLLPGSPAIDAGDDTVLNPPDNLTTDQRGEARMSGAHVDIGALEYNGLINGVVQPTLLTDLQFSSAGFQFDFNGATQTGYSVLVSSNLTSWVVLGPAIEISRGWYSFQDSTMTNFANQFYRVSHPYAPRF